MCGKKLILGVVIALACVQLASCLTCYSCLNERDCTKPKKVTCSNVEANLTSSYLEVHHQNVRKMNSYSFYCLNLKYTYQNNMTTTFQLQGCVHPDVNACNLSLKPQFSNWRKWNCNVCSGNKCNKNPAGKMSSSLYTIAATILALTVAKIYA